jgi:hypothetical protein
MINSQKSTEALISTGILIAQRHLSVIIIQSTTYQVHRTQLPVTAAKAHAKTPYIAFLSTHLDARQEKNPEFDIIIEQ